MLNAIVTRASRWLAAREQQRQDAELGRRLREWHEYGDLVFVACSTELADNAAVWSNPIEVRFARVDGKRGPMFREMLVRNASTYPVDAGKFSRIG